MTGYTVTAWAPVVHPFLSMLAVLALLTLVAFGPAAIYAIATRKDNR